MIIILIKHIRIVVLGARDDDDTEKKKIQTHIYIYTHIHINRNTPNLVVRHVTKTTLPINNFKRFDKQSKRLNMYIVTEFFFEKVILKQCLRQRFSEVRRSETIECIKYVY